MREYGWERLVASGESESTQQAHAAFYAALAARAEPELTGSAQACWLDRLETELDNLRAALTWSIAHDPGMALRLAAGLWRFWYVRGHLREGREIPGAGVGTRGRLTSRAGQGVPRGGRSGAGAGQLRAGHDAARDWADRGTDSGEQATAAQCLNALGFIARNQGAYEQADRLHGEALALQRELGTGAPSPARWPT